MTTPPGGGAEAGPDKTAEAPAAKTAPDAQGATEKATHHVTEADALRSAQGESADRQDALRSMNILADRVRQLVDAPNVVNIYAPSRDVNFGPAGTLTGASGARPAAVGTNHLAEYTRDFVEPPAFGDGLHILGERHLLVLSGPSGTGREATALALLDKLVTAPADGDTPVYSLAVGALADNQWQVPVAGAGYLAVVGPSSGSAFEKFDDAWLNRISSAMRDAGSFLVVVTGQLRGLLIEATRRRTYVVEEFVPPPAMDVLLAKVHSAGLDIAAHELEGRLLDAGVEELLTERPWPRFATTVAITVVETLRAGKELPVELSRLRDPGDQVREWFTHHEEPEHIALALAAAVLEGSSYLTVSDAAVTLYEALTHRGSPSPRLRLRRSIATDQPWITIVTPEPAGLAGPPCVRFRSPLSQQAILIYAWNELDGLRPTMLGWLRGLVAHPDVEVRARAAFAVGQLATDDFQHAVHHYLLPWAEDDSQLLRKGAALALSVVATVPRHTSKVWAILQEFAESAQSGRGEHAPGTAAIAAAGPLGSKEPERALRLLREVARNGDWDLLNSIVIGILQLLQNGRTADVVAALMDWTEAGGTSPVVVKGLVAYVVAAREPTDDADHDEYGGGSDPGHPALLVEAATYHDELPELWGRALDNDKVRAVALDGLREWLRIADGEQDLYLTVQDVLAGIADRGRRDMERLEHYLAGWERDEDDPSPAAGSILRALRAAS